MRFSQEVYCPIRGTWVTSLPEELVRQNLLTKMLQEGQFPKGLIVVEKSLKELFPKTQKPPKRRVDILVFYKREASLLPLLLIECKAGPLNQAAKRQLIGYNYYLKVPFLALANSTEIHLGAYHPQKKEWLFQETMPSYSSLLELTLRKNGFLEAKANSFLGVEA